MHVHMCAQTFISLHLKYFTGNFLRLRTVSYATMVLWLPWANGGTHISTGCPKNVFLFVYSMASFIENIKHAKQHYVLPRDELKYSILRLPVRDPSRCSRSCFVSFNKLLLKIYSILRGYHSVTQWERKGMACNQGYTRVWYCNE